MALLAALAAAPAALADPDVEYTTSNPDLRSVTLTDQIAINDGVPNRVRFCFDQPLGSTNPGGGDLDGFDYYLLGYDSDKAAYDTQQGEGNGGAPAIDPNATNCVVVDFRDAVDLTQMTIGGVDRDVVRRVGANNSSAAGNSPDNYPLGGSRNNTAAAPGRTEGPDLVTTQVRGDVNEIVYTFDEDLTPTTEGDETLDKCDQRKFGYYTTAGAGNGPNQGAHRGDTCAISGNRVTIGFTTPGDDVNQAVRIFVDAGAVFDLPAQNAGSGNFDATNVNPNPYGENDGQTNSPDLVDARRVNATQVDFEFDEPVANCQVAAPDPTTEGTTPGFILHQEDSRSLGATQCTNLQSNPKVVRATFPNSSSINLFDYVLAAVAEGAVQGSSQGETNTTGADPIATSVARPGFTDGPDLVGEAMNTDTDEVAYVFDENIADDVANVNPCHFYVVDPNGLVDFANPTAGASTQLSGANAVVVRFNFDIDRRIAAGYISRPGDLPNSCQREIGVARAAAVDTGNNGLITDAADADATESGGNSRNIAGFTATSGIGLGTQPSSTGAGGKPPVSSPTGTTPATNPGILRARPRSLSLRISPRRDRTAPFRFRYSGRLTPPRSLTATDRCRSRGIVSVQTKIGRKTISTRRTRLRANCTYSVRLTIRDRVRVRQARRAGRLRVRARFLGNKYMLPKYSARKSALTG